MGAGTWRSHTLAAECVCLEEVWKFWGTIHVSQNKNCHAQDRKCHCLRFTKLPLAALRFADTSVVFVTGSIRSFEPPPPFPSLPCSCLPDTEGSIAEHFYTSVCSPSHPADVPLEDDRPSSSGTHHRVLRTCRAPSAPGQLLPWEGLSALSWRHLKLPPPKATKIRTAIILQVKGPPICKVMF